jgi:very-short-patch-repair endonuclease
MVVRPGSALPIAPAALPVIRLAADHTRQDVARRVRSGEWTRVGRGAYLPTDAERTARRSALARVVATHHRLTAPHVFSHDSAALLWGLPLWALPRVVHVYQRRRPGPRRDPTVRRHLGALADATVTTVGGLPVTTLAQTAVDCARTMPPRAALVVVDAALRAGASPEEMARLLALDPSGRGCARARAVVELGDAGAESPQETALRFVILRAGLPRPETQVRIESRLGTFWADLGWAAWRVVLEYDGRQKYADLDSLVREKRRHDALTEAGWRVIRVTKEDLASPAALVARVQRFLPQDAPRERRPHLRAI